MNNNETTRFQINVDQTEEAEHILGDVLAALKKRVMSPSDSWSVTFSLEILRYNES